MAFTPMMAGGGWYGYGRGRTPLSARVGKWWLEDEDQPVYFRYYDPTILRRFLPTCDAEQLSAFFDPVNAFLAEDTEANQLLRFIYKAGKLHCQPMAGQNVGT